MGEGIFHSSDEHQPNNKKDADVSRVPLSHLLETNSHHNKDVESSSSSKQSSSSSSSLSSASYPSILSSSSSLSSKSLSSSSSSSTSKLSAVSYLWKFSENDNVEGGGDKEFHTDDDISYNKKMKKKTRRSRRDIFTSIKNQYNISSSSSNSSKSEERPIAKIDIQKSNPQFPDTKSPASSLSSTMVKVPITQQQLKLDNLKVNLAAFPEEQSMPISDSLNKSIDSRNELNLIENQNHNLNEQIIIISSGDGISGGKVKDSDSKSRNVDDMLMSDEPRVLPLRPIIRGPYDDEHQGEMSVVYAEPHTEVRLNCDVDLDILSTRWIKDGQVSTFDYYYYY